MFYNKQALIGLYGASAPTEVQLTGFSITTTAGNIFVEWGDGTSSNIGSNVLTNHTFYCPDYGITSSFWSGIQPCR